MSIKSVIGASVVSSFATTALLTIHPAAYAATAFATIASAVNCATTGACVSGTNTSSGPGVSGTSAKGYGVEGVSTSNDGLKGISTSSNGVSGSSTSALGAKGISSTSYGVYGASTSGSGVYGQTSATKTKQAGIVGKDLSTKYGDTNDGVLGVVTGGGYGVEGDASTNASGGVLGNATTGNGVDGMSESGYGVTATTETGSSALEVYNAKGTYGVFAEAPKIGLLGYSLAGDPLSLVGQNGGTVFFVDSTGNVHYSGMLESDTRAGNGTTIASFSPRSTRPTVEDTGNARLTGGGASVAFDPALAASIDTSASYDVFLTPDGDTRGLYVASKTSRGFTVRESQGGRSSVAFAYRIVAVAAGHATQRMSAVDPNVLPHVDVPDVLARRRR